MNQDCSIFIQGEGKGHFSQAMEAKELLEKKGFQINGIYLGKSLMRKTPSYFRKIAGQKLKSYLSPNFIRTPDKKGIQIFLSIFINLVLSPVYLFESIRIAILIRKNKPAFVLNFYEPIAALSMKHWNRRIPQAIISHHFYLSHPDFIHPHGMEKSYFWLQMMNRFMKRRADMVFALSFRKGDDYKKIKLIPPLVTRELKEGLSSENSEEQKNRVTTDESSSKAGADLCYFLNKGFIKDAISFYSEHPELKADVFCDLESYPGLPDNVNLHLPSREYFLEKLQKCQRLIATAGFDLVAEAFYLGKPVFLLPAKNHYEQYCNALDAARTGLAFQLEHFSDLKEIEFTPRSNKSYREWLKQGELLLPVALNTYLNR